MLRTLYIRNYALITSLNIEFDGGFSVLTGETGAGKSIILGALNLLMGGRADTKTITDGEERCVIEAVFSEPKSITSRKRVDNESITNADINDIIIRRELNRNGRSRSFVNDEVVTQAELKTLAARLLDIHSQNENLLLGDEAFQLSMVDTLAANGSERAAYTAAYDAWRDSERELRELEAEAQKTRKEQDYIAFQHSQLAEAQLSDPDEMTQLETEEYRLSHVEQLQLALQTALQALDGEESGALQLVRQARTAIQDEEELGGRLGSVEIELKDIAGELSSLSAETEADPERLQFVQERIALLQSLMRKHGVQTLAGLIELREQWSRQLERIDSFDAEIAAKRREAEALFDNMRHSAQSLTESRTRILQPAAAHLTEDLQALGMAHAKVSIELHEAEEYTESGHDAVELMFAANLNQQLRRVGEVASGGETSRLMLCIKAMTAEENGQKTLIFDEIDTGVSGAVAARMGQIMRQMGASRQVIAITHLPQVAACGEAQYRVYKQDTAARTETHIRRLTDDERVEEIAAMLAADQVSTASKQAAKELLAQAGTGK